VPVTSPANRCLTRLHLSLPHRARLPEAGAYSSEMSYFAPNWQTDAWGDNYPRLAALKEKYDPTGLFMAHHYVGNEKWSRDGFI